MSVDYFLHAWDTDAGRLQVQDQEESMSLKSGEWQFQIVHTGESHQRLPVMSQNQPSEKQSLGYQKHPWMAAPPRHGDCRED